MLQQALTTVPASEAPPAPWHQGDLGYLSIWTPDLARASAFYESVLGWTYDHYDGKGHQVIGQSMAIGLWGGQESSSTLLRLCRRRRRRGRSSGARRGRYGLGPRGCALWADL